MKKTNLITNLLLFVLFIIGGLFLSQFLAIACLLPFHQWDISTLIEKINQPLGHPEMKMQMLFIQGISAFCAFILAPIAFIRWKEDEVTHFLSPNNLQVNLLGFTFLLVIISMPFTSMVVEWNESLKLPPDLSAWEKWAREKEDYLKEVTEMLTALNNPQELFWGLLVIAFIPALGEELVFRGYLQNKLKQLSNNYHIAIWLSAFLFSTIHFQFYGFFPRMLLGALFGYIYAFSGQFLLPVAAHFTNNGLMLIMIYLKNKGHISFDIEKEEHIPLSLVIGSLVGTVILFYLFVRRVKRNELLTDSD